MDRKKERVLITILRSAMKHRKYSHADRKRTMGIIIQKNVIRKNSSARRKNILIHLSAIPIRKQM